MIGRIVGFWMAASLELAGCFFMWRFFEKGHLIDLAIATVQLVLFAFLLAVLVQGTPGRVFAIYGLIYVILATSFGAYLGELELRGRDLIGIILGMAGIVTLMSK